MRLTAAHRQLLRAMADGRTLKAHRYLDGSKEYRLHDTQQQSDIIDRKTVEALLERGLIDSNKKFPAATYWLTGAGRAQLG